MGQRQIGMCVPAIIDVILNWVQDQVLSIDDVVDRDAETILNQVQHKVQHDIFHRCS